MTEEISQFIIDTLKSKKYAAVTGSSSLGPAGLDLESLAVAELVVQIEDRFGVKTDEAEMERYAMMTIGDIAQEIAKRVTAAGQQSASGAGTGARA